MTRPVNVTPRRRRSLVLALIGGLAIVVVGAGSLALFTDTEQLTGNAFTVGTIDLTLTPSSAAISMSGMMPGDVANGSVLVANAGTAQLRYAVTGSADNLDGLNLRDELQFTIKTVGTDCATFDGTTLYSGVLASAAFGNPAPGQDLGDRVLNAGSNETLCLRASLASNASDSYQGAATTLTLTFDAEQTANNP